MQLSAINKGLLCMINCNQNKKNGQIGHKTALNSQNCILLVFFLVLGNITSQPDELCEFYTFWVHWLNFMGPVGKK